MQTNICLAISNKPNLL